MLEEVSVRADGVEVVEEEEVKELFSRIRLGCCWCPL